MQKNYRASGVGTIGAAPGTYLVHAYFDENQVDLVRANVVGWTISSDSKVRPLVVDPRAADDEDWFIEHPDGRVECSDGRAWPDIDAWVDESKRLQRGAA